jgi:tetratricopeptide (TPR) repeat protein
MYRLAGLGLLFVILLSTPSSVAAFQGGAELVSVPSAIMPEGGSAEFGIKTSGFVKDETEFLYDSSLFMTFSLTDDLQYGFLVRDDFNARHSIQGRLKSYYSEDGSIGQHFAVGVKNVGYVTKNIETTEPVFDFFAVYSLELKEHRASYHLAFTQDRKDGRRAALVGGVEYGFDFGSTIFEWDGQTINLGLKYTKEKGRNLYFSISPRPLEKEGYHPLYATIAYSISDNIFEKFAKSIISRAEYNKDQALIDNRIKTVEARESALADMIAVDFLSQLEQSFIDRQLIKKKMDSETKSLVKGALGHMQRGLEYYYKKEFKAALEEYKTVVSLLPTFPMGHVRLGSIYYQLGDKYRAKKAWEKALELEPKNPSLRDYLKRMIDTAEKESLPIERQPIRLGTDVNDEGLLFKQVQDAAQKVLEEENRASEAAE